MEDQASPQLLGAVVCWEINEFSADREALRAAFVAAWPNAASAIPKAPGAKLRARIGDAAAQRVDGIELSKILTTLVCGTWKRPLLGGTSLRQGTGIAYFVPMSTMDYLGELHTAATSLCQSVGRWDLMAISVRDTPINRVQVVTMVERDFIDIIDRIRFEWMATVRELKRGGKKPDARNILVRQKRYNALESRIELYRNIGEFQGVRARLASEREEMRKTLEALRA